MIDAKESLEGNISFQQPIDGDLNTAIVSISPGLENLQVTPSKEEQVFNHENSYGYDVVTVAAIPDSYIEPSGTLQITENGTYNVKEYEQATVEVEGSGGGSIPVTSISSFIDSMNNSITNVKNELEQFATELVNTYETYTTEPVTLYSPASGYNYYVIRRRGEGLYGIIWFDTSSFIYPNGATTNFSVAGVEFNWYNNITPFEAIQLPTLKLDILYLTGYTSSINYSTIEECISAIQNPNTSYSSGSYNNWGNISENEYIVPVTNLPCINSLEQNALSRRISSNETIKTM